MHKVDVDSLLQGKQSKYALVVGVAKRAREISEKAEEDGEIMIEKPVSIALDEILSGKYKIIEPEEIRYILVYFKGCSV